MKLRVLGCHGGELSDRGSCGFLINRSVLLEGGTVCSSLTLSEQRRIRYVLVSHIHMDHVKDLLFMSENLIRRKGQKPVVLIGLRKVVEGLRRHVFNDRVWPDFTRIPSKRAPVFRLKAIREGEIARIDGLEIRAFRVNHAIPCAGFLIRQRNKALVFSGDTHQTEKIWKAARDSPGLKAAMIETSFPNRFRSVAVKSRHLTPALLAREFSKLRKPDLPLFVYHMKPRYVDEIRREVRRLKIKNLRVLETGMVIEL
jgi:cAMP phosphodiesterase